MMACRWLTLHPAKLTCCLYHFFKHAFDGMQNLYRRTLVACLAHRRIVMIAFALILVATAALFVYVPKGFLPSDDTGQLFVFTEADQDVGFDEMARKHNAAAKIIRDDPAVAGVMAFMGVSGSSATLNLGRM